MTAASQAVPLRVPETPSPAQAPPRFLVVAGEASGDHHAAGVVRAVRRSCPEASFFGMGGSQLRDEGVETLFDAHQIAVMGISEVVGRLPRILRALSALVRLAKERQPSAALLVDLPDFNLRLARRLRQLGIPVIYYISPMVWAWRRGRTRQIARDVDRLLCIYPFEEPFLRARGVAATYVGNPLLDEPAPPAAAEARRMIGLRPDVPTLAVLPGSRESEVRRLFVPMLEAAERLRGDGALQIVVPVASTLDAAMLGDLATGHGGDLHFHHGATSAALAAADLALVASGTATLEVALAGLPMVVVYRTSMLSWLVGRLLVRVRHVAIVNLLAGQRLVPELIQGAMTPRAMSQALDHVWRDPGQREFQGRGYRRVRDRLGGPGAGEHVAQALLAAVKRGPIGATGAAR
jgi:lipid-A-disaccharide synthase